MRSVRTPPACFFRFAQHAGGVRTKLFARFHQDGEPLGVSADFDERKEMMNTDPEK